MLARRKDRPRKARFMASARARPRTVSRNTVVTVKNVGVGEGVQEAPAGFANEEVGVVGQTHEGLDVGDEAVPSRPDSARNRDWCTAESSGYTITRASTKMVGESSIAAIGPSPGEQLPRRRRLPGWGVPGCAPAGGAVVVVILDLAGVAVCLGRPVSTSRPGGWGLNCWDLRLLRRPLSLACMSFSAVSVSFSPVIAASASSWMALVVAPYWTTLGRGWALFSEVSRVEKNGRSATTAGSSREAYTGRGKTGRGASGPVPRW